MYLHQQTAQSNFASSPCTSPADACDSTLECEQVDLHINKKQVKLSNYVGEAPVRGQIF